MDQTVRNKLRNVVTQCRKLLEDATAQALQGRFGIYAARKMGEVHIEDESRMAHLSDEDRACRQDLLDHLAHIRAIGYTPREALEQLIREIAFTHLNRLCAYKMMEARGLIRESVSRGLKSQGFFFYLADHPEDEKLHNAGKQDVAYRNFLNWLGGTLSEEIGVLFNPNDPANRIYPPQRVLDEVLDLINEGALSGIWSQDETIGWVYQYFTPKELRRDKAREESQAPRNSYELAFRNQFYTPRYVVEFLTDNTLGRIWYEMRKGKTALKDRCRYLVRRPTEIFLNEGEEPPAEAKETRDDLSQEELLKQPVYIPHRPKKDPHEIKILDPACGSGHFLLYCFDLLQVIYEEAYDDPDLGAALRNDYPSLDDLRRAVPGLILKHNLHGIDIDPRATQIAALALWLRCQRAFQELGLKNGERPKITRSNIVTAEPMPGEEDMRREFIEALRPKVLGQLVEVVFDKMKLAGEAGSLLKIEEEIRDAVAEAKKQWVEGPKPEQAVLFPELVEPKPEQGTLFDVKEITDEEFWNQAEERILTALKEYAERAENGRILRRRLFAEDAARGFAFVDICRKRFDVVLMNPPFGESVPTSSSYISRTVPNWCKNLASAFMGRMITLLADEAKVGTVTDRTVLIKSSYEDFRVSYVLDALTIGPLADLGWGVLDANVEVSAVVFSRTASSTNESLFLDCREEQTKESLLYDLINPNVVHPKKRWLTPRSFARLPNAAIAHDMPGFVIRWFNTYPLLKEGPAKALQGHAIKMDWYGRLKWEISPAFIGPTSIWTNMYNGGSFSRFYLPLVEVVRWNHDGTFLKFHPSTRWSNAESQQKPGIGYGKRGEVLDAHIVPAGHVFTVEGLFVLPESIADAWYYLGILNSPLCSVILNYYCGQHKHAGYVDLLPVPAPDNSDKEKRHVSELAREAWELQRHIDTGNEASPFFVASWLHVFSDSSGRFDKAQEYVTVRASSITKLVGELEECVEAVYGLNESERAVIAEELQKAFNEEGRNNEDEEAGGTGTVDIRNVAHDSVSYAVGVIFGRWDVRMALDPSLAPKLPDPFDPLPVCPPGMLVGPDGLPAKPGRIVSEEWLQARPDANTLPPDGAVSNPTIPDSEYPLRINWDGILVDDPGHEDDIVRRVREVLEVIWKDRAEAIEKEACKILGVRELRSYFRKSAKGGFWKDHVRRYSKSRRKAPIYWYLRSAKGNYGLWLYYHRLDKDILFKALLNYVEPKIRLEEDHLNTLRARKEAAGKSGREAKQIEKDIDRQEQFVSELRDFADKLRRVADLHLEPDLNDGVILNIAPLWELVPWKEPKKYWEALQEGKYDWSHIAYQLWPDRVKEKCRTDRSIAIAHGREDLCEVEPPRAPRKKRVKR